MLIRAVFVSLIFAVTTSPVFGSPTAADVAQLAAYLDGAFDSEAQNTAQVAAGSAEGDSHTRVTIFQRTIDLDEFAGHVLYNQE